MGENASLDDFLSDDGEDEDGAAAGGGNADTPEHAGEPEDPSSDSGRRNDAEGGQVPPATSTYRWAPGGRPCDGCGATARRLWRDGEALVCPDCKEWSAR